ncbi:phage tail assembly chaperone [Listeria ivanovii]|uniref:phage tail assembly chaperone n=1 Tax=Listeria ivanovii TaxID=1638 RepID=UPI0019420138|nr:phage tail assembly chaperone [Listeria ivanovii]MBM5707670.1 hypothetical protein [Listeria ivanovii]
MAQNNIVKIDLEETYQELQLGKELYKVSLGDETRRRWIEVDEIYKEKVSKLDKHNNDDIDEMSKEDYIALEEEVKEVLKEAYAILLDDEEAFSKLYSQCKDILRMYSLYDQITEVFVRRMTEQQNEIQKKYKAKMTKKAK